MVVSRDHIPYQGNVQREHVMARMKFKKLVDAPGQYAITEQELELHRQFIKSSICGWLKTFILYVANEVGMSIGDNKIITWNDFMYWVENCVHNRDDAIKIMKTLYTSFQYIDDCH